MATADINNKETVLARVHESIQNKTALHTLRSDFQTRDYIDVFDVGSKRHGRRQVIKQSQGITIPLQMKECVMMFQIRQSTEREINTLKVNWITLDEFWDPKKYFDDLAEEFYDFSEESDKNEEDKEITALNTK